MLEIKNYLKPMNLIAQKHFGEVSLATHSALEQWSVGKEEIYTAFGNSKRIKSKEVAITESNYSEVLRSHEEFLETLQEMVCDEDIQEDMMAYLIDAVGLKGFRENRVMHKWTGNIGEREVVVNKGMKFSRSLSFLFPLDEESTREAQDLYSTYRQGFSSRKPGHLYLSIEPLDFLSVSDNNHNWSTCQSMTDGEYRVGNYNLMTDSVTVVGYYASEEDMDVRLQSFGDIAKWNSKRWRVLIHLKKVENTWVALYNKEYPFRSEVLLSELDKLLVETLDIGETTSLQNYTNIKVDYTRLYQPTGDTCAYLDLSSNAKFGKVRGPKEILQGTKQMIPMEIGEPIMCLQCGSHVATRGYEGTCDFCADEYHCEWCGGEYDLGELSYMKAENGYVCFDCKDHFSNVSGAC